MPTERPLVIDCHGERLLGILHEARAGSPRRPGVLVIVGGPQYRVGSHRQFVVMARQLAAAGYPVLRFDYRGMGDSEGEVRPFDAVDDDVRAAIDAWCTADPTLPGVVLWGLCDGASAAMMYCSQDARVVGLVAVNPWVRTEAAEARSYVRHYYLDRVLQRSFWVKLATLRVDLVASLADLFSKLRTTRVSPSGRASGHESPGFIERMRSALDNFPGSLLVVTSERDLTAKQFEELVAADDSWGATMGRCKAKFRTIGGADHTFSSVDAAHDATMFLLQWLDSAVPGQDQCR